MKCSNCGNEMITSRTGWLCVSCGHAELSRPNDAPALAQIIHERPRGRIEPPAEDPEDPNIPRSHRTSEATVTPPPAVSPAAHAPASVPTDAPAPIAAAVAVAPAATPPAHTVPPAQVVAAAPTVAALAPVAAATPIAPPAAPSPVAAVPATMPAPAETEAENKGLDTVISEISAAVAEQSHIPAAAIVSAPTPAAALHPAAPVISARLSTPAPAPASPAPAPATPAPVPVPATAPSPAPTLDVLKVSDLVPHTALSSSPAVAAALAEPLAPAPIKAPAERKPILDLLRPNNKNQPALPVESLPEPQPESQPIVATQPVVAAVVLPPVPAAPQPAAPAPVTTPVAPPAPIVVPAAPVAAPVTTPVVDPAPPAVPATASKPPLQPKTHPKPMSVPRHALAWAGIVVVILILMVTAFMLGSGRNPLDLFRQAEAAPAASSVAHAPSSSAQVLSSTSYDPGIADSQRLQDINLYATAFAKPQRNGFYAVKPPAVLVAQSDPSTHEPYRISVNPPAAPGDIQYQLGGSCTGASRTPGRGGSQLLALRIFLETSLSPACVQVNQP